MIQDSGLARALIVTILLFSLHYSDSQAQSLSQPTSTFTFQVSQNIADGSVTTNSNDSLLSPQNCCNVSSTLTSIDPCSNALTRKDGQDSQSAEDDPCCCVDLDVFWSEPTFCTYPVCGLDIAFDDGVSNPLCNVCSLPPGWNYTIDDPYDGIIHLNYSGKDCSGAFGSPYGNHFHFAFCGQNLTGSLCYTIKVYQCITDPESGRCVASSSPICSPHFCNDLSCSMAGVTAGKQSWLTVDAGYPNPATSSIRFGFSSRREGRMSMTLVDLLGRTVSISNSSISAGEGNITIGLTGAQPGA